MKKIIFLLSILSSFVCADKLDTNNFYASFGFAKVRAHEYVWADKVLLSKLDWDSKPIPFMQLKYNKLLLNAIVFEASMYTSLFNTKAYMIDDDWADGVSEDGTLLPNTPRDPSKHTHHSEHPNTKVQSLFGLDFMLRSKGITFYGTKISAGLGYKYDYVEFSAKDGWYKYNCDNYPNGCTKEGTVSGTVIDYSQAFNNIYLGLFLSWENILFEGFGAGISTKLSIFSLASDLDKHFKRGLEFETISNDIGFNNFAMFLRYKLDSRFSLTFECDYTKYKHKISDVYITEKGITSLALDGSSFDNKTIKSSIGVLYRF